MGMNEVFWEKVSVMIVLDYTRYHSSMTFLLKLTISSREPKARLNHRPQNSKIDQYIVITMDLNSWYIFLQFNK